MKRPVALVLGPSREAMSGVTTHVNLLLGSRLADDYALWHFQVGSEGRNEGALARWLRLAASPWQLAATLLRLEAEIVHVNSSLNARAYWRDLAYIAVAKLCGAKVLYQVHGGALPQKFFRLAPSFLRAALRWPDALVVLAHVELQAYQAFGVPALVVPNGIDCTLFTRYNRAPADAGAPLKLAYVGRLAPEKGLYETFEALVLLRESGTAARLVVAGSGPEEARLRSRVRELKLQKDVSFVGALEGDQKARLLSQSDVLLLASYSEGLPYALLEGMAAGAVPVASPVGAIPDVMHDGVHGLLVPARQSAPIARALARLGSDRAALARMSAACRKRIAAGYSIERVAAELSGVYNRLVPCAASQAG